MLKNKLKIISDIQYAQIHIISLILMSILQYVTALLLLLSIECKLHQVVSMFRHGARYHLNSYYDGNATKEYWGELTAVGMRQHETFGKMLRKDYIQNLGYLSDTFQEGSIDVISTDVNRTIESVRSQLYGLYPLGYGPKIQSVPKEYHLPPFSNTTDSSEDIFALAQGHLPFIIPFDDSVVMTDCSNWDALVQRNINIQKPVFDEMNATYYPFFKRMSQMFNINLSIMNFSKISSLYDTITVDKYLGRPLPDDFTDEDYLNQRHLHYWYNYFKINFNLTKAVNTGKLKKVMKQFDDRISNANKTLKWSFLSAHDTDISSMLLDLNVSSSQCVQELYRKGKTDALNCDPAQQFVSNIIFELHSDNDKDFYIKIRHDGNYVYLCQAKMTSCPYQQWKQRVKQNIILDERQLYELCYSKLPNKNGRFQSAFSE